jgi:hypothetical protein
MVFFSLFSVELLCCMKSPNASVNPFPLARAAGKEPLKTSSRALQMHKNRGVAIADMKGRGVSLNGGILGDSGGSSDARVVFALSGSRLSSTFLISRTFMTNAVNGSGVVSGGPLVEPQAPVQLRFLGKGTYRARKDTVSWVFFCLRVPFSSVVDPSPREGASGR